MAIAIVQHGGVVNDGTNGNTAVGTISSTTANLIVCAISRSVNDTVTGVIDNIGNTYIQATSARGGAGASFCDVWYCATAGAGVTTVTVTYTITSTATRKLDVFEVSGFTTAGLDVAAGGGHNGIANVYVGETLTTTSTSGFIVGTINMTSTVDQNPTTGNEFTSGGDLIGTGGAACSLLSVTATTHTPSWHCTALPTAAYSNSVAAFKETGASSSPIIGSLSSRGRATASISEFQSPKTFFPIGDYHWIGDN